MYKKFFLSAIIILIIFIWKDYKKIDLNYINQNKITYSYDNLNNNLLKKIHNFININYQNFLYKNFDGHRNYWTLEDPNLREELPEFKFVKKADNLTLSIKQYENIGKDWARSHGDNTSHRFSSLKKINISNASKIEKVWRFQDEEALNDIQANPIVVNGIIYTPTSSGKIFAIDGESGNVIWKSKTFGYFVARRGLLYSETNSTSFPSRLYFSNRERLICLNPENGKLIDEFGGDGQIRTGLNVMTPVIFEDNIIIVTWDHAVEVYDLITGKTKWKLKFKKDLDKRVGSKQYINDGYNPWGGISLDEQRGLLFFTTGNPHYYFDGTQRPGDNKPSNSIVAVDIINKKIIWTFQETSHDIWNSDLPAPPILTSIKIENKKVDVVLTPTKRSNTLILDRLTGKPIFNFRLRKAPFSKLPGEKTSRYQPDLETPEPFGKNIFSQEDFWSYDKSKIEVIKNKYKEYTYGFYEPYELSKKNLQYNFNGGAEWMGASVDHKKNIMYVSTNNIPWEASVEKSDTNKDEPPAYYSVFKRALDEKGYPISKPPWGTITALNLNSGKKIWQIPFGEYKELKSLGLQRTGTENFGGVTGSEGNLIFATGTLDKKFYVFNSLTGEEVYSYELPFIGSAPPTTYLYNNKQYIIVQATGGRTLMQGYPDLVEKGNMIIAFTIKD